MTLQHDLSLAVMQGLPLIPSYVLVYYMIRFLLPLRSGRKWKVGYALTCLLVMAPKPIFDLHWLLYNTDRWLSCVQAAFMATVMPLAIFLCFAGDWRRNLFCIFPYCCFQSALIAPCLLLVNNLHWPRPQLQCLLLGVAVFLVMLLTSALALVLTRLLTQQVEKLPGPAYTVLALASPLTNLLYNFIQGAMLITEPDRVRAIRLTLPLMLAEAAVVAAVFLFLLHRSNQQDLEIAAAYEAMQNSNLQAQQANHEALRQLRTEHNRRLRQLREMLGAGQTRAALALVQQLTRQENRAVRRYADNPVADVALAEADRRCRQAGLPLTIRGALARDCPLPAVDLASLLYNLLSNAAEAAAQGPRPGYVDVQFTMLAGRLCVTVRNTAPAAGAPRRPGHGFGQQILRDIVARYDGSYTLTLQGGQAVAQAMVCLPAPNPAAPTAKEGAHVG